MKAESKAAREEAKLSPKERQALMQKEREEQDMAVAARVYDLAQKYGTAMTRIMFVCRLQWYNLAYDRGDKSGIS